MQRADHVGPSCDLADVPQPQAPYYDEARETWIFSRYSDVMAALRSPSLLPTSATSEEPVEPNDTKFRAMRAATQKSLSRTQLRVWHDRISSQANDLAKSLPVGSPVELLGDFAQPLCLALAAMVTNVDPADVDRLYVLTEPVAAAAAEPYDQKLKKRAKVAAASARTCFESGPEPLRDSGFIALTHTLPCLLGSGWFALLQRPGPWANTHRNPESLRYLVEEMMRRAEVPRILFRRALIDLEIGGVQVHRGDLITLNIVNANHDPDKFKNAERFSVLPCRVRHLTLGSGPHSCVGASLIRMAITALTRPLMERFSSATLHRPVEFTGGTGYRSPSSLWVILNE
jgi:cytochrome P450